MDLPSKTIVDVMTFLLPGLVTAAILYTLTPAPKPVPFERTVQALIFTIVVQVLVTGVNYAGHWAGRHVLAVGPWTERIALVWSVAIALVLGLFLVWASNTDKLHAILRKARITHQTSYASEWYGAFCRNQGYIVLHLKGDRRLLGWAEEWPSTPDAGHFVMLEAEWLGSKDYEPTPLTAVERILIRAQDVEMVEMMKLVTEQEHHGGQQAAGTASTLESGVVRERRSIEPAPAAQTGGATPAATETLERA